MIQRLTLLSCVLLVASVPLPPTPDESKCNHTLPEPDFEHDGLMQGPGVGVNGNLPKGRYVYSSTNLAIQLSTSPAQPSAQRS